jgi:hypothetical protein
MREERLAAALRQNLKRRKDASRATDAPAADPKPQAKPDPTQASPAPGCLVAAVIVR